MRQRNMQMRWSSILSLSIALLSFAPCVGQATQWRAEVQYYDGLDTRAGETECHPYEYDAIYEAYENTPEGYALASYVLEECAKGSADGDQSSDELGYQAKDVSAATTNAQPYRGIWIVTVDASSSNGNQTLSYSAEVPIRTRSDLRELLYKIKRVKEKMNFETVIIKARHRNVEFPTRFQGKSKKGAKNKKK